MRIWLNAIGIFAATTLVIVGFDLSPLWYSAALLAWIVRWQRVYHAPSAPIAPAQAGASPPSRPSPSPPSPI
jgi:hypothetical protein